MSECVKRRPEQLATVIKGLMKTYPDYDKDEILSELFAAIKDDWIKKVFSRSITKSVKDKNNPLKKSADRIPSVFETLYMGSQLSKLLRAAVEKEFKAFAANGNLLIELD